MECDKNKTQAYLVGGGIASLSSAVYLIHDGHIPGENIHVLEESKLLGGSLDAAELSSRKGYTMRGFRMFEEKVYSCMYELFSHIPSVRDPKRTLRDELFMFDKKIKIHAKVRLIKNGKAINARKFGLTLRDRAALLKLLTRYESSLGRLRIDEYFSPSFFRSNFYYEFGTTFSFQPWSSLAEFRRYVLRFLHDSPMLDTLDPIRSTKYNQYESMIIPIVEWLKKHGVNFIMQAEVIDLDFLPMKAKKTVTSIKYSLQGKKRKIRVRESDLVFVTLGSMTADSSLGSMTTAPQALHKPSTAWDLWKNISKKHSDFGNPSNFCENIEKSKWVSFTITHKTPTFFRLMKKLTGKKAGTDGHITLIDSNWLITIGLPNQPHFIDQPSDITVSWGYGLFPNEKGNYINKKMAECTGEEIMTEILTHLKFNKYTKSIIETSICIPNLMPYITSHFLPRDAHDRPLVIPNGSTNLALIGQYCEIPEDIAFTVEYSIRSAQTAVYKLLNIDKKLPPIYKGQYEIKVMRSVLKTVFR